MWEEWDKKDWYLCRCWDCGDEAWVKCDADELGCRECGSSELIELDPERKIKAY